MSKKKNKVEDEDIDGDIEDVPFEDPQVDEDSNDLEDPDIDILSMDDEIDIIIEVSDSIDLDLDVEEAKPDDTEIDVILSKHQMVGKHSLRYDSIFKGKKDDKANEDDSTVGYFNEKFEVDKSSFFYTESFESEEYNRSKNLKEKVYNVLLDHTNINFLNNRRKPSKIDFNNYYHLLFQNLESEKFSNTELFNELSVYFSDNLFNMFKLLDNRWRNLIIDELQDHIGKNKNSKEISNRNIYIGTEVEFSHDDEFGETRYYTGVVAETIYEESLFTIDSYENLYDVYIDSITKILNNTKFKYNLNKLNNIDFL